MFSLLAFDRLWPVCQTKRERKRQNTAKSFSPPFFPFVANRTSRLLSAARRNKDVSPADLFMASRYAAPEQSAATGSLHFYKWTLKGRKKRSELCDCHCVFMQHPSRRQQACRQRHTITTWTRKSLASKGLAVVLGIQSSRAMEMIGTLVIQTVSNSISEGNRNALVWLLESHGVCSWRGKSGLLSYETRSLE